MLASRSIRHPAGATRVSATQVELLAHLRSLPGSDPVATQDRKNSISSKVIRCHYDGQRAVAVAAEHGAKVQIPALLDLLDLNHHVWGRQDEVTLVVGQPSSEALDAVGTLVSCMTSGPAVRVVSLAGDGTARDVDAQAQTFASDAEYPRWKGLLMAVESGPPQLLRDLVAAVKEKAGSRHRESGGALRAYQMLSSKGRWSLRLEGLEIGRFKADAGRLDVGKLGSRGDESTQRKAWKQATGATGGIDVDGRTLDEAASKVLAFATTWLPAVEPGGSASLKQDEHALESRVLRGHAPVDVPGTGRLQLIRKDDVVNWGSQFPTKWGRGGSARYLDALLRDGRTPWAVEIKIQGGTGVGGYYRHAIAQAVLYRHFIREAQPLDPWFEKFDLDRGACQAAVLVPDMATLATSQQHWRGRLRVVAELFDLPVLEIDPKYAGIH